MRLLFIATRSIKFDFGGQLWAYGRYSTKEKTYFIRGTLDACATDVRDVIAREQLSRLE